MAPPAVASSAAQPLYAAIADELSELILTGRLRAGQRVPSVRRTSAQREVSPGTIVQAYRLVESRGLIESRPQSGFYVSERQHAALAEPRSARPSDAAVPVGPDQAIVALYHAGADPKLVPLGIAVKSPELTPTSELDRALRRVTRSAGSHAYSYERLEGSLALRRQLARRSVGWGSALHPDEILITTGAAEALHLCLRAVTEPGDAVAVEAPSYYGVLRLLESLRLKVVEVPVGADGIDLDALRAACSAQRIRAVIAIPNFNNPTGSLQPNDKKAELVRELAARGIPLIEDDIFGDLPHHGERPRPAKAWDKQGLVLSCNSLSKSLSAGLRIGWVSGGRFHQRLIELKLGQSSSCATIPQLVAADVLESGAYDRFLRVLRAKLGEQVAGLRTLVGDHFPAGTRVSRPRGGHVLWVELPQGHDATELARRALKAGISVIPGPLFSARGRFKNFLRLNAGYPIDDRIASAVRTLGSLAAR